MRTHAVDLKTTAHTLPAVPQPAGSLHCYAALALSGAAPDDSRSVHVQAVYNLLHNALAAHQYARFAPQLHRYLQHAARHIVLELSQSHELVQHRVADGHGYTAAHITILRSTQNLVLTLPMRVVKGCTRAILTQSLDKKVATST